MLGTGYLGQLVGLQVGQYLGRQIALGACRDDTDDDVEKRPFPLASGQALPAAVDLRPWMTPVEEQGALGSCTSNALAGALEYLIRRERGQHIDLSRLFVYFNQRLWDDRVREDTGASIASGIRVLSRLGIPRESSWPYQRDLFAVQPPEAVIREASEHRVTDWWYVPIQADALRGCLAAGFPVVFGTRVTESFVNTPRTGLSGMPSGVDDRRHGRHALLLAGYDDARQLFIVKNSWGDDWGDRGYVYMPYAYVLNPSWTQSGWAIRLTTRDRFDVDGPVVLPAFGTPRAPPEDAGTTGMVATVANMGAQVAVGALTGSSLLAGLAGGLFAGVTPGVAKVIRGRDRGAYVDRDRSDELLAAMRGGDAPPSAHAPTPWTAAPAPAPVPPPIATPAAVPPPIATPAAVPPPPVAPTAPAPRPVDFVTRLPARLAATWRELGGRTGALGSPVSEPARLQDGTWSGSVVRFEHGALFVWDPRPERPLSEPFALLDAEPAVARWLELGAGHSPVGWPTAPIAVAAGARALWCTRGVLIASSQVFALFGTLFAAWRERGGASGELGLPVADQVVPEDPREPQLARFERGTLAWSAARGVWRE